MTKVTKLSRASSIKDVNDLRDYALNILDKLESGQIELKEAGVTAKICETVMTTARTQIEYAKALGRDPNIPFMGNCLGEYTQDHKIKHNKLLSASETINHYDDKQY